MRKGLVIMLIAAIMSTLPFTFAAPHASAGTTWIVRAGSSQQNQTLQALRFLPKEITINEGDTVQWAIGGGAHPVYFPAGQKLPELIVPGKKKGEFVFNPAVVLPSPQKTYDGSGPLSGGVLGQEPGMQPTYSVAFVKAGTYKYICAFHPGMEGTITVQAAGSPYPKTQAEYDQIATNEAKAALARARQLYESSKPVVTGMPGKRTITLNIVGSLEDGATFWRFPGGPRVEISRGDTVTWVMKDPTELHTVTFGAKGPFEVVIVQPQPQGPPTLLVNPKAMAPAGGKVLRGTGFYNSGFMTAGMPGTVGRYSLTFTRSGSYQYFCATHAFYGMRATIVVK